MHNERTATPALDYATTLPTETFTTSTGMKIQAVVIEQEINRTLAVVDLITLQRLARLLPIANLRTIKADLCDVLLSDKINTIELFVRELSNEIAFHTTVNVISTINSEKNDKLSY